MPTKIAASPQRREYITEQLRKIDEVLVPLLDRSKALTKLLNPSSGDIEAVERSKQLSDEERTGLQHEFDQIKQPITDLRQKRLHLEEKLEIDKQIKDMASQRYFPGMMEAISDKSEGQDRWEELGFVSPEKLLTLCKHLLEFPGHDETKREIERMTEEIEQLLPDLRKALDRVEEIRKDFAPLMENYQNRLKEIEAEFSYTPSEEEFLAP